MSAGGTINVTTLVSASDRTGRVQVVGPGVKLQLSSDEARALSANLAEAATFAEADAFLFHFIRETVGTDDQGAAILLSQFREYREARVAQPLSGTPEVQS